MTDRYRISYSINSLDDLREIYSYMVNELNVPQTASALLQKIRKKFVH